MFGIAADLAERETLRRFQLISPARFIELRKLLESQQGEKASSRWSGIY
jgi:hypothetical protein